MLNKQKEIILNVPFYSQIYDIKKKNWQNRACGVVCLKMIVSFYDKKYKSKPVEEFIKKGLELKAYKKGEGWYHFGLAKIARKWGFQGWYRKWILADKDKKNCKEKGLSKKEINEIEEQLLKEGINSLYQSIKNRHPVVVAVPKKFKKGESGHLVVLTGIKNWDDGKCTGFYFNDPYNPNGEEKKNIFVSYNKFINIWSKRAVFIKPK